MGVDEGNLHIINVGVILENCPITIPLRYILTTSDYGVCNSHYILLRICYITFVTAGRVRDRTAISSGSTHTDAPHTRKT